MVKIIEAKPKIKKVFAFYYVDNIDELKEFLNVINKNLHLSYLHVHQDHLEINEFDMEEGRDYFQCRFYPYQFIIIELSGENPTIPSDNKYDLIRVFSMDEELFDDQFITTKMSNI